VSEPQSKKTPNAIKPIQAIQSIICKIILSKNNIHHEIVKAESVKAIKIETALFICVFKKSITFLTLSPLPDDINI